MSINSIKPTASTMAAPEMETARVPSRPKHVPSTANPPVQHNVMVGEASLLHSISNTLPTLGGISPALYRRYLAHTREVLTSEARGNSEGVLGQAMVRAAQFLEEERCLLEAMETYRNLLHRG